MKYLSHSGGKRLTDHINNMLSYDSSLPYFSDAVKWHDCGKVTDSFQKYIQGETRENDGHSIVSAFLYLLSSVEEKDLPEQKHKLFTFIAILCHHGKLKPFHLIHEQFFENTKPNIKNLAQDIISKPDAVEFFKIKPLDDKKKNKLGYAIDELEFNVDDFVEQKLLFSELIFADKFEAIFGTAYTPSKPILAYDRLTEYKARLRYNAERSRAAEQIFNAYQANKTAPIYTLTAPTGIGKTLISLELALRISKDRNLNKIIYTIPFTSIIDQTAEIFEAIFPDSITVHHHKTDFSKNISDETNNKSYDRQKYITESWCGEFMLSTLYQLLYAFFSSENSDNIKFQSIKKAVIVIDEVQSIHADLWKPLKHLLSVITDKLGCVFVMMSATMPIITADKNSIELADKEQLFPTKNRYRLEYLELSDEKLSNISNKIYSEYNNGKSVLCVVNTIKTAKTLYKIISESVDNVFCLNSYMLPQDRKLVIKALTESSSNNVKNKILISTQVIEAGIDLDFDIGFRENAPLSSIIQTAGRVNREGSKENAVIYVFDTITDFCIYSDIQMNATHTTLISRLKKETVYEKDILPITDKYFKHLDLLLANGEGEFIDGVKKFDFEKIDKLLAHCFDEKNPTLSVAVGVDLKALEQELYAKNIDDVWAFRTEKQRTLKSISDKIINIKRKDLESCGVAPYQSDLFGIAGFSFKDGIYSDKTGFLIKEERDKNSNFF